jgi:hypothetical protein
MDVTLCLVFGSRDRAVVWAGAYETDQPPMAGQSTQIHLHTRPDMEEDPEPEIIVAEVVHSEVSEEGETVVFLYAGEYIPDERIVSLLSALRWLPMADNQAQDVMEIVAAAPPMARLHDVLLIVGELDGLDNEGNPSVEAWNRTISADDPVIPMFGERMYLDVIDAISMDEEYLLEDEYEDGEESELVEGDEGVVFVPEANENNIGSAADGLPAVVFYAAKVDPGEAQVGFWVSSLGDITGFDLVAAGWEKMTADTFDPIEFRLSERVELSRRTRIDTEFDEEGQIVLNDFEVKNASEVTESQYALLPSALVNHCRAAKEMLSIDDIVSGWVDEQGKG